MRVICRVRAAAMAFLVLAGACGPPGDGATAGARLDPPPGLGLQPVPGPDFATMEASVEAQMRAAHTSLRERIDDAGATARELSRAYGEMANLLMAAARPRDGRAVLPERARPRSERPALGLLSRSPLPQHRPADGGGGELRACPAARPRRRRDAGLARGGVPRTGAPGRGAAAVRPRPRPRSRLGRGVVRRRPRCAGGAASTARPWRRSSGRWRSTPAPASSTIRWASRIVDWGSRSGRSATWPSREPSRCNPWIL